MLVEKIINNIMKYTDEKPSCDFVKNPLCAFVVKNLTTKEHKGFTKEHKEIISVISG